MKFYDSVGPNPRVVRMFMAEKAIEVPKQTVDLRKGENREAEHLKRNPHGQMPTLELDNGDYLSEITAICEYLEEKHPAPPMIGTTPRYRASSTSVHSSVKPSGPGSTMTTSPSRTRRRIATNGVEGSNRSRYPLFPKYSPSLLAASRMSSSELA